MNVPWSLKTSDCRWGPINSAVCPNLSVHWLPFCMTVAPRSLLFTLFLLLFQSPPFISESLQCFICPANNCAPCHPSSQFLSLLPYGEGCPSRQGLILVVPHPSLCGWCVCGLWYQYMRDCGGADPLPTSMLYFVTCTLKQNYLCSEFCFVFNEYSYFLIWL